MEDLPFRAEYAKSSRASCKGCKNSIGQGSLRLAVMIQSPKFDGKVPNWYHERCFFTKQRPKTTDDIAHFESLRWEDQEKIKGKISSAGTAVVPEPKGKKGKKRDAAAASAKKAALADFHIEYSKSSRATCRGCEIKIMKGEIRISKKDYESEIGRRYGGQDLWHHLSCFAKLRSELQYFESADQLPGFKSLRKEDQAEVKKEIPAIKQEEQLEIKKPKIEEDVVDSALEKEMKEHNKLIYKHRDQLAALNKNQLIELLEANKQQIPEGVDRILDRLSDIMTFGALLPCDKCKGQFTFHKCGYICSGDLTEWTKCNNFVKVPKRKAFVVPKDLKEAYSFLKAYKYKKRDRAVKEGQPPTSTAVKKEEEDDENSKPKIERQKPALYDMEIVILGNLSQNKDELKKKITLLGGKVVTKIKDTVMAIISTQAEVDKMTSRIQEAQDADIQVVSEDFLDAAKDYAGRIPDLIIEKSICSWGSDPNQRLPAEKSVDFKSKSRSMFKSKSGKVKLQVKGGSAVDPDSNLAHVAHVYVSGSEKYNVVLGKTDIQSGKNSFYKIQLLESDIGRRYWLFTSWGRIGTSIGGSKTDEMGLDSALRRFKDTYMEKSGNSWADRDSFTKVAGKMYPIDIDYGEDDLDMTSTVPSNLPKQVEDLMHLIFDIQEMKSVMKEFELDMDKMPLGKLSKKQLQNAMSVLTELQQLIDADKKDQTMIIDATNRFYTLVPHSFGVDNPPPIDNLEDIKKKTEMLENLMEMEIAFNLMKVSTGTESNSADVQYEKLNTDIHVLDRNTEDFQIIQEYLRKTHAPTHSNYELEIEEAFVVKRQGEEKRFKPFKKLSNRKLLWHGSRRTNFGGILSQGLRIAPPEAPVTGYMFGKGIYFADMVSKSANYCCTSSANPTGLLLLCEVALGEMHELTESNYIEKLPKGKHSVKGIGRTHPNPKEYKKILDNIEVPVGSPVTKSDFYSALLYNEYIVYDVAQVHVRYLLQTKFKYKYAFM